MPWKPSLPHVSLDNHSRRSVTGSCWARQRRPRRSCHGIRCPPLKSPRRRVCRARCPSARTIAQHVRRDGRDAPRRRIADGLLHIRDARPDCANLVICRGGHAPQRLHVKKECRSVKRTALRVEPDPRSCFAYGHNPLALNCAHRYPPVSLRLVPARSMFANRLVEPTPRSEQPAQVPSGR